MKNHHEELRWQKGWWDRMKEERIRWALWWFRWRFPTRCRGNLNSGKKRWKHLKLEFIHQEQTPKKRINHSDEIRIRFIVCLSFIKLNWWQAMDFAYYLFFLKRIEKWHIANLRRSSWTTISIQKWLTKDYESPGRIRRTNMLEGI